MLFPFFRFLNFPQEKLIKSKKEFSTMKVVISLSGSFFTENLKNNKLEEYVKVLKDLERETEKLVIVCGAGGRKDYIKATKGFDISEAKRDLVGIKATRLHASLLNSILGDKAYPEIPESIEEVERIIENEKIVTMGGTEPGHSTDAVAALAGEIIDADLFINATDVDGVYDKNPKKHEEAEKLDKLSYEELFNIIAEERTDAGSYALLDFTAAKIIQRSELKTVIIDGTDPEEILRTFKGKHSGSIIE